ncbi:MAG: chitobiase/beta-hexosaminidase C-terminal domain-containing protein [Polaribacter sp.]
MKKLIFFGCLLLVFAACKQEKTNTLLQDKDIQLVSPRVTVSNLIIDSLVTLKAELKMNGIKIYYTDDGSEPTKNSKLYEQPLEIVSPGVYKLKAFHPAWKMSETETVEFVKKGKPIDTIIWETNYHQKYKGKGANTLINNRKAMVGFMDSEWLGFDTIARATAMFKDITDVKSLHIGYLNNPAAWIFPPEQINVFVSYDGKSFVEKEKLKLPPLQQAINQKMETISISINKKVKAIKIEVKNVEEIPSWHQGVGNPAWVFMDEWIFN